MSNEKTSFSQDSNFQNDYVSDKIEHSLKHIVPLSFGEEVGNSVSHGKYYDCVYIITSVHGCLYVS